MPELPKASADVPPPKALKPCRKVGLSHISIMAKRPDYRSEEAKAYRHLYWTQRWRKKAKAQREEEPLCRRCAARGLIVPATVANHIIPHRGDLTLFWEGELESTCAPCHDGVIAFEEARGYGKDIGEDGWPSDPRHPSNHHGC